MMINKLNKNILHIHNIIMDFRKVYKWLILYLFALLFNSLRKKCSISFVICLLSLTKNLTEVIRTKTLVYLWQIWQFIKNDKRCARMLRWTNTYAIVQWFMCECCGLIFFNKPCMKISALSQKMAVQWCTLHMAMHKF